MPINRPGVIVFSKNTQPEESIYQEFFSGKENSPTITISAIVGENGSGKSTIVEYVMRLINNFAAATLGEFSQSNRSFEHIHFINDVNGSLIFQKDDYIWEIRINKRVVSLYRFTRSPQGIIDIIEYCTDYNEPFWTNGAEQVIDTPFPEWNGNPSLKEIYKALFYTYVSNYSIYAYNTGDYIEENNNINYERRSRKIGNQFINIPNDELNWLHGLFHKNDGYQCPLVLGPYRKDGNIDINNENYLSKERLIALLILSPEGFSVINGHLVAKELSLKKSKIIYDAAYLRRGKKDEKLYTKIDKKGWDTFRRLIPKFWGEVYGLGDLSQFKERPNYEYALNYLTYKTLKIAAHYKQYNGFYKDHRNVRRNVKEDQLKKLIVKLSIDHSHITRKIRQTLAYIEYGAYVVAEQKEIVVDIKQDVAHKVKGILQSEKLKEEKNHGKRYIRYYDELVPPPIFETEINLVDSKSGQAVRFETLSSGERQQAYTISSLLYHLSNLESIFHDSNKERITYSHVNLILEELELYFHPELQKNLISYLLDGIKQIALKEIKAINICLVTHSPFILSDIQSSNIMALGKDGAEKEGLCTFGANIHDLLKSNFLHNSVIGDYSQWFINRIIICLQVYRYEKEKVWKHSIENEYYFLRDYINYKPEADKRDRLSFKMDVFRAKYPPEKLLRWINMIDEPLIRHSLLGEYDRVVGTLTKQMAIMRLEEELNRLKNINLE